MEPPSSSHDTLYAIGEVSALTGLSTHTVRVWERRYGRPVAVRLPSGHRRYAQEQVDWLRGMAELLSYGHRPGNLAQLDDAGLQELLQHERGLLIPHHDDLDQLLEQVAREGVGVVEERLESAMCRLGRRRALHEFVAPLVQLVGRKWAAGELTVRHEHMITELVMDALRLARAGLHAELEREGGPHLVLATLPGERHGLGLEMVHLLAQAAGAESRVLGVDLPVDEVAASGREYPQATVAVSLSANFPAADAERALTELVAKLPDGQELLVGGQGARRLRRRVPGMTILDGLTDFEDWLRARFGVDCFDR